MRKADLIVELRKLHARVTGAEAKAIAFFEREFSNRTEFRDLAIAASLKSQNDILAADIEALIFSIEHPFPRFRRTA
jgi:hypothetical protein